MRDDELIVEVRDKTLARVGSITPEYRQMKIVPRVNDVGTWELTLPGEHPMVDALMTPGSGIIVTQITGPSTTRVLMSGPTSAPTFVRNRDNPDGLLTFSGVSDSIIAADAVAYGDPANLSTAQTVANDVRTGNAETIMRAYVNANIGPGAIASRKTQMRQYVALATNLNRGPSMTKSPRFQNLLELLQEIAIYSSLTFRFVQIGSQIVFEIGAITDRSALVRLDIETGTLDSEQIQQVPASATRAIVAGQGEGTARVIVERTSTDSAAAETNWGRVIERFLDARDKSVTAELQQQGDEFLIANGAVDYAIKATASDSQTMRYGIDWVEGDIVAVIVDGGEQDVNVVSAAIVDGPDGVLVGMAVGDIAKMERSTTTEQRVDNLESRVSTIERSDDSAPGAVAATPGTLALRDGSGRTQVATPVAAADAVPKSYADALVPVGGTIGWYGTSDPAASGGIEFMIPDGRAISRTTYATLFALIGTTFGAGNGTTTFNIPNEKGRVAVGRDSGQTEFDVLGEMGGEKNHTLTLGESPAHDHGGVTGAGGDHDHGGATGSTTPTAEFALTDAASNPSGTSTVDRASATGSVNNPINGAAHTHSIPASGTHTHSVASAGGGGAHNNLQPYIVRNSALRVK
jgi:microcystin-dependent protein